MTSKKKPSSKPTRKATDINLRSAIASGKDAAADVIAFRAKQLRKRSTRESEVPESMTKDAMPKGMPPKMLALFGSRKSVGVILAEGDSWFDYPMRDVLGLLEDDYLYDVESVAHKGDCVDDMAHSQGQFEEFARRFEKLLRDGKVPRAILLSGGGNDIAGDEFAILLNHATSTLPPLNESIVSGLVDVRLKEAYVRILSGLSDRQVLSRSAPADRRTWI